MNAEPPETGTQGAANAALELAQLLDSIGEARAELSQLQQAVVGAASRLGSAPAAHLLQINEQLVVSGLRAHAEAKAAKDALAEASRVAGLDPLTGLPNRVRLLDRLALAIAGAKRHGGLLAVLFMDLDGFKQINDTYGHAVGDQVLQLTAGRLTASVRAADTVSRLGGDEFVILLTEVSHASDALLIANKVGAALAESCRIGDQELHLAASIDISLYPRDGEDASVLIDRADDAMYHAKRNGPGQLVAFSHQERRADTG